MTQEASDLARILIVPGMFYIIGGAVVAGMGIYGMMLEDSFDKWVPFRVTYNWQILLLGLAIAVFWLPGSIVALIFWAAQRREK